MLQLEAELGLCLVHANTFRGQRKRAGGFSRGGERCAIEISWEDSGESSLDSLDSLDCLTCRRGGYSSIYIRLYIIDYTMPGRESLSWFYMGIYTRYILLPVEQSPV